MIYNFLELKLFVQRHLGVDPDSINSKFKPITQKLTRAELDRNVQIDDDGIFFLDKKGNRHKGFLYIESGYSQRIIEKAGTRLPKFHILNCETIQQQKERKNLSRLISGLVLNIQVLKNQTIVGDLA